MVDPELEREVDAEVISEVDGVLDIEVLLVVDLDIEAVVDTVDVAEADTDDVCVVVGEVTSHSNVPFDSVSITLFRAVFAISHVLRLDNINAGCSCKPTPLGKASVWFAQVNTTTLSENSVCSATRFVSAIAASSHNTAVGFGLTVMLFVYCFEVMIQRSESALDWLQPIGSPFCLLISYSTPARSRSAFTGYSCVRFPTKLQS